MQTSASVPKDRQINFRFGEEDFARLDALSSYYEMSAAQVVRMLLKHAVETLQRDGSARPAIGVYGGSGSGRSLPKKRGRKMKASK